MENYQYQEFGVPCLDQGGCRQVFRTREAAIAHAEAEGIKVIEARSVTPWRPVPDWPPEPSEP